MPYSYTLIKGAGATGPGNAVDLTETVGKHSLSVSFTGGGSALSIAFEGTQDGSTWHTIVTHNLSAAEISAKKAMWHIVDKPVRTIRANISTLTGGDANTSITVLYEKG